MKNRILTLGLVGNAFFSFVSGAALVIAPRPIGQFIGIHAPLPLVVIGCLLLPFAGHLLLAARRSRPRVGEIYYFSLMDGLWVLASAVLLLSGTVGLTTPGIWIIALVALVVADFLVLQLVGAARLRKQLADRA